MYFSFDTNVNLNYVLPFYLTFDLNCDLNFMSDLQANFLVKVQGKVNNKTKLEAISEVKVLTKSKVNV